MLFVVTGVIRMQVDWYTHTPQYTGGLVYWY